MKRPLCSVALLYIGGILAGQWLHLPLHFLFLASFALAAAALFSFRARIYLLTVLLPLLGWTNIAWRTAVISPNDLRRLAGPETQQATVRGTLHATPMARIYERHHNETWRSSVVIDTSGIRFSNTWQAAAGKIIAYAPVDLSSNFFAGQSVEVSGVLAPPPGPRAEGLFDARSNYRHQSIYYELRTDSLQDWKTASAINPMPLSDRFSAWARTTLACGLPNEDLALRLIWTLALDWKAPLTAAVEEPFMRAGTYHIFAVDGLRIGLLSVIGIGLLRVLRLPRAICGMLVIPLIWSYAGLTNWPASAVRAAIMMTIIIGGWAGHRPSDLVNSLFAAALVILLWDPNQLFQPGFQLSFLVVFCIALLVPPMRDLFRAWTMKKDPFLPEALAQRWPPALHAIVSYIFNIAAVSLAAWLGSVPLGAAYFHLFTPVSVIANVVVVPITALALMSSMGSLLTGAAHLGDLVVLCNHASWFFMQCVIHLSRWTARWPGGAWNVSTPAPVTFLLYYGALFSIFTGWLFRPKFKWPVAVGIIGLSCVWLAQRIEQNHSTRLYFLPLNGGAAVFADNARPGESELFDCGNELSAQFVVKPFLCAQGVNTLDSLALTTGHVQDGGGAMVVLTNFSVGQLYLNSMPARSTAYRDIVDTAKQTARWRTLQAGDMGGGWRVLNPQAGRQFADADDNALVFRREIKGNSILLLSSLGRSGQDLLLERNPNLRADVVVAGMPAKDEPLCEPLLRQLQPKLIIIIDSDFPATRRASSKFRERLANSGAAVLYCRDTGALKLTLRENGWDLKNASEERLISNETRH